MTQLRPRIGLISAYFRLFDAQMPADFRERQEAISLRFRKTLEADFEVTFFSGLLTSDEEGAEAGRKLREAAVDAVVFAPVMAAPPSYVVAALQDLDVPIVLWNAPAVRTLGEDLDQASAHEHTTLLGVLMLANVLVRRGMRAHTVTASLADRDGLERLRRMVRSVAAASKLRDGTVLRIGDPYPGYLDVEVDPPHLEQLGLREQRVEADELDAAFAAVDDDQLKDLRSELSRNGWSGEADGSGSRVAVLMRELSTRHGAICGTVNCHGSMLRNNPRIGVAACLGVSACTAAGVPFSCTGDLPTAIALAIGRALAGSVLYCEFYAPELDSGLLLLSNGGEGDTGLSADPVRIVPSAHYPGVNGPGAAVAFEPQPGPATLISMSPIGEDWRLVWALGELVESRYPRMEAPNAMFSFESTGGAGETQAGDAARKLDHWLASGATHHIALVPGHLDLELPLFAETLGIESVRVAHD